MFKNLTDVAYIGEKFVKKPIKAVVLSFHGLGHGGMKDYPDGDELEFNASGALCVFPYYGPWSWMNRASRALVDEIVERVYKEFELGDDIPLIIRGGSMGGHAALNYSRYSKRKPAAVACNCPVTDPLFHSTERPDLPRTFLLAYGMGEEPIEEVFKENSPVEQAANMPFVPYFIVHGTDDKAVNKQAHSDVFVKKMRETGHNIEYIEAKDMGHCGFIDFAIYRRYQDFVLSFIKK